MFVRILEIFLPLLAVILVGYLYARRFKPDFSDSVRIAQDIALPALSFSALSTMTVSILDEGLFVMAIILIMLFSAVVSWISARRLGIDSRAFVTTMTFGNVGQIGLPLTALAFGPEGLKAGVIVMVVSNVIHFSLGVQIMSGRADLKVLYTNPTIWATVAGLTFSFTGAALPSWCMVAIRTLGDMLVPVMLMSMGARMISIPWSSWRIGTFGGLYAPFVRLVPALALAAFLPLPDVQRGALILYAVLPPAIFNYMMADRYGREAGRIAAMVMIGHLLAIGLLPFGLYLALR